MFQVSCRLCKLKSHIPLTCEDNKKENGISERRVIEEARTEALIRTCSKCKVRILKEDGCNKVICTSCYAVLCDYCGKDISKVMYNHFDSESGRAPAGLITVPGGKCPLYDESNKRKDQQVEAAEKEAMNKVRADHPELSEEDLKIKFAKSVQQSSNKHHRHPVRPFPRPPPLPPLRGFEDPPQLFGPRYDPRLLNGPANAMGPMPGAFPGVNEDPLRLHQQQHQQRQQQMAYQAFMQAQQQRQLQAQQQRLNQAQVRQEILIERNAERNHAHAQANRAPGREVRFNDRILFGADGALDADERPVNGNPLIFDPRRGHDRPNRLIPRPHDFQVRLREDDRLREGQNVRLRDENTPIRVRQEGTIATATQEIEDAPEAQQRQPFQAREPGHLDRFYEFALQGNPWL